RIFPSLLFFPQGYFTFREIAAVDSCFSSHIKWHIVRTNVSVFAVLYSTRGYSESFLESRRRIRIF
ncbi:hypothetical protein X975_00212, partial [Stegodyphus mimosarum]